MKKIQIEVIKTHFDEDLAKEYGVKSPCPAHKVGEVFISNGFDKPENFCDEAWKAIYQYVFALAHMGENEIFYFKDWITKPKVAINSCNDGVRPVIFKLTQLDEESKTPELYQRDEG
ncbi:TIGR04076 family protein [Helicobacter monodelphidis]|uniref:TIGR04076 family protein n=1 Tax=Helicobacter sp. 15-1451 TaxID=2004995 RepID=UPI000DCC8615|nr:TIGR04076 family protein [Helicobacter sp. 15-1451]RAX57027.1 TIGR04076 family protein [Helicobacter sp. 15-1451]